jgi:hypothetical protein
VQPLVIDERREVDIGRPRRADARRDAVQLLDLHNHGNLTATGSGEA